MSKIIFIIIFFIFSATNYCIASDELKDLNENEQYKSIMFSDIDIDNIFQALSMSSENEDDDKNDIPHENQIVNENNTAVYLNSILFISKNNWSVWINGNKITNSDNGKGDIKVISISPLKAFLKWNIGKSRWKVLNKNNKIPADRYTITDNGVDVYFSLSPNQSFIPMSNKIVEGATQIKSNKNNNSNKKKINEEISKQDNLFF